MWWPWRYRFPDEAFAREERRPLDALDLGWDLAFDLEAGALRLREPDELLLLDFARPPFPLLLAVARRLGSSSSSSSSCGSSSSSSCSSRSSSRSSSPSA